MARKNMIAHLRDQIQAGTYVTPGKIAIAADKILDEMPQAQPPHIRKGSTWRNGDARTAKTPR
jgi:hypothetical protein